MFTRLASFRSVNRGFLGAAILLAFAPLSPAFAQRPALEIDPLGFSDHQGEDFEGFDFRGRDLTYGDYSAAKLRGASFAGAEIDRATFDRADLRETTGWAEADVGLGIQAEGALFDGADLSGALCDGYFEGASFRDADLSNATLSGRFHGAAFDGASVDGALFLGAGGTESLKEELRTRGAIVDGEGFAQAAANGRSFRKASLHGVRLAGVDLSDVDFEEAELHSARLSGSDLSGTNFQKALLAWAEADEAKFDGADLSKSVCVGMQAERASFRGATLVATEFGSASLREADFTEADLTNADLRGADLTGANLAGAKLDGLQIDDAILDDVQGLGEEELAALRSRAARWRHDLERSWRDFLRSSSLPLHLALTALALGLTIAGGALGRLRMTFAVLSGANAVVFLPFILFVLFSLAGGSPVAQMSSFGMWQLWLGAWPLLLLVVASAGVVSAAVGIWEVVGRAVEGPRNLLPLSIAMAIMTPLNAFFAFQFLILAAPDA